MKPTLSSQPMPLNMSNGFPLFSPSGMVFGSPGSNLMISQGQIPVLILMVKIHVDVLAVQGGEPHMNVCLCSSPAFMLLEK